MVEVKFSWKDEHAQLVMLAGSFNGWIPQPMNKINNTWQLTVNLIVAKTYLYKFIVDGIWRSDDTKETVDDNHGGRNNVVFVNSASSLEDSPPSPRPESKQSKQPKQPKQSTTTKQQNIQSQQLKQNKLQTKVKPLSKDKLQKPDYWEERLALWDKIKQAQSPQPGPAITITLPDGATKQGQAGVTTPMDIANDISKVLAQNVVVSKVNGILWDLLRPLESDCNLELIKFDSDEGKKVFWHSSAHIMGQALEYIFNCSLCMGPALRNGGFYYDMATPMDENGQNLTFEHEDAKLVEQVVEKIVNEKQPFERLVLTKEEAYEMFRYNKYKTQIISEKVQDGETCTAYRCGPLIDLCKGPHLPHTGKIKAFKVWKNASAYWKSDAANDSLQRVYGMTFPDKKMFTAWQQELELAKKRDHRLQGTLQELFFFHELSPGSPFFLPRGVKVYNKLVDFVRNEYKKRGFTEVISPNMFNKNLWETSGHWEHYKDDMFLLRVEEQDFALKPMNCPGHCLMYLSKGKRPYKELPIRFADFGVLHRNELSGALTGLTRVRRFCQDDAHIFCRPDQIASEMRACFEFLKYVYDIFGWHFTLELSTRPEKKYIGEIETWNHAEAQLAECLNEFVGEGGWKINKGDGAFYGPKIDIHVFDALKREHQCATIQLDFNLPKNFDLKYIQENDTEARPVMIHRAIFGSLERFMAILIENTAGKWPFWLSPRPCIILTLSSKHDEYAKKLCSEFLDYGFESDVDLSDHTLPKKVLLSQQQYYNYVLCVGDTEVENNTVNVRLNNQTKEYTIPQLIDEWRQLLKEHK
eukprot:TRINITY_DN5160_c0_g1_i1.p1 TRINITY_DN5160_c0_g1~~TRINITY_DN5160_c0_g1_i1.p1  ORF type:complete len:810 (+),score=163.09 TRINITY_DN5160_c0_g1_i1:45-2474(+)